MYGAATSHTHSVAAVQPYRDSAALQGQCSHAAHTLSSGSAAMQGRCSIQYSPSVAAVQHAVLTPRIDKITRVMTLVLKLLS